VVGLDGSSEEVLLRALIERFWQLCKHDIQGCAL
jgi:hypothetical protein